MYFYPRAPCGATTAGHHFFIDLASYVIGFGVGRFLLEMVMHRTLMFLLAFAFFGMRGGSGGRSAPGKSDRNPKYQQKLAQWRLPNRPKPARKRPGGSQKPLWSRSGRIKTGTETETQKETA